MTNEGVLDYRRMLAAAEEEAREALGRRRPALTIERHSDDIDEMLASLDREQSVTAFEQAANTLREVRAAYRRIEEGTFGQCVRCGAEIPPKRLRALPWTRHCLPCQEEVDERRKTGELSAA